MKEILIVCFIIVSILLIAIILLQSDKASGASQALTGGVDLFADRKERGSEVVITKLTYTIGFVFCAIAFVLSVMK